MCVQTDYNFDSQSACSIHRQLSSSIGLPSLYYDEGSNNNLLNNERINIRKDQVKYHLSQSFQNRLLIKFYNQRGSSLLSSSTA